LRTVTPLSLWKFEALRIQQKGEHFSILQYY
jgi:hypothetical protein